MKKNIQRTRLRSPAKTALMGVLVWASALASPAWASDLRLQTDALEQPADTALEMVVQRQALRSAVPTSYIDLGEWLQAQDHAPDAHGALQIGQARLSLATQSSGATGAHMQWSPTESGGWVTAMTFRSGGAYALRLGVLVDQLPGSAMLRVYHPNRPDDQFAIAGQRILQLLQLNHDAGDTTDDGRTWWTPESMDDQLTLEIELPPGTNPNQLRISIPQVMHVYADLLVLEQADSTHQAQIGEADTCHADATCYSEYAAQLNAVARMTFVKNGGSYLCTGTLLNDTSSSRTPYFLTANHCLNTQTIASSLQTRWFYKSSSCNAATLSSSNRTLYNGAQLLYATASQDATLLRLNEAPPAGVTFSGWDANTMLLNEAAIGIHHPKGDMAKISLGQSNAYYDCQTSSTSSMSCTSRNYDYGNYYSIKWSTGTTEGGSSGSGLFKNKRLTGVLYGGSDSCSNRNGTAVYGRFDKLYPAIRQWLAGEPARPAVARQPVFRFFNHATGAHFYTNSVAERDSIIATLPTYQYEGTAFYAATQAGAGLDGVSRFFNTQSASHFYTINAAERDSIRGNLPHYRYEGLTWYANTSSAAGNRPIYRFYNESIGTHFFTATEAERDTIIRDLPAYRYEGIGYYVWSTP